MTTDTAEEHVPRGPPIIQTRGYQQELLQESLRRNIIIALDTGSGKTHIAMLRMKHEVEQQSTKLCWFLAPTVALIEQQRDVIAAAIPVKVCLISGASEPDQWKDASLWSQVLADYRIIISTPQILLDALRHGYVLLGRDVGLLVFDEAHHAALKHPYNEIMKAFYHPLPYREPGVVQPFARPAVLGLTASPVYGGSSIDKAFRSLEANLDCVIRSSRVNRDELSTFVHRPVFKHLMYSEPEFDTYGASMTSNILALHNLLGSLDIEDDPYVISLRLQLNKLPAGDQRNRVDQTLSKTIRNRDTFTHKGLRDLQRTGEELCTELGSWAADWYIHKVIEQVLKEAQLHNGVMASWQAKEKTYLLHVLSQLQLSPLSDNADDIRAAISAKVKVLISCLHREEKASRDQAEPYSGIIFVTRRASVLALSEILCRLPDVTSHFRIGCLLGSSGSVKRNSLQDITRSLLKQTPTETLKDFRTGEKNLVVATSVAEEGLDIQACGCVIRFDPPQNMVAWAQSRGRARKEKSTYVVMFGNDKSAVSKVMQWEQIERDMVALYTNVNRVNDETEDEIPDDFLSFQVESTGALLTLDSAVSHLYHFCAVLPQVGHVPQAPLFDLDPPDVEEGWHSLDPRPPPPPYQGPWGATCTLPRQVPPHLRTFSTSVVYPSKRSARNHAAFFTYHRLYLEGLLNDNLLPLTSVIEPDEDGAVKLLLKEVEQRAGMANVPIQMDPWSVSKDESRWWCNEVSIEGLPDLYMFTRRPLPELARDELPTLFVPGKGASEVKLRTGAIEIVEDGIISRAQEYTHRTLRCVHYARMDFGKLAFCYLFLPREQSAKDIEWERRCDWQRQRLEGMQRSRFENPERANAEELAKAFDYPLDFGIIRSNDKFDKGLQFIGWHDGPISPEEEEELRERYDGVPGFELTYPLLVVQPFPKRSNFLVPLDDETSGLAKEYPFLLHPRHATVDLLSAYDVQYAFQLPSVLRFLSMGVTVNDMRSTLLGPRPTLASIPFKLIKTALTAPVTQEPMNYERLETLGDTVLKYLTSIQLFSRYPLWHEGYLARRKDHAICNTRLAKEAIRLDLEKWIIRDRFVPRKWKPRYVDEPLVAPKPSLQNNLKEPVAVEQAPAEVNPDDGEVDVDGQEKPAVEQKVTKRKRKAQTQQLSTKMMADVAEALIGAAYEHGGFDLGLECIRLFDLGLEHWDPLPKCIDTALKRVEEANELPDHLSLVEDMLGYRFSRKMLLAEALTHPSYTGDLDTVAYQRLEFLGDAVLDIIVTDYLYHARGKNYSPGHMHLRKEALVNAHLLAYVCMNTSTIVDATMPSWNRHEGVIMTANMQHFHLHQCIMHSSTHVLDDMTVVTARFEKHGASIRRALEKDDAYPWAALTSLQAPKFISDMVESILGAIFLDSHGDLDVVRDVLRTLGIMFIMERIVADDVDVLHPVSRLYIWAAKNEKKCKIQTSKADGNISCTVFVDEVEEFKVTEKFRGKASQNEVRFAAAEGAIRKLNVIEQEEPEDVDDCEWGDVPEWTF